MIQVNHLSFSYEDGNEVLRDISLEFDKRPTAIIGENGAGKTTFVKLLKGLLKLDTGEIHIGEANIQNTTAAALSKRIGLVFQNPNDQIFKGKVMDEVMFGPLNIGQDEKTASENVRNALAWVGLEDRIQENPQDLSLSEKKLLCIASVLAMDTEVIILDEPTMAQDHIGKDKISQIIQTLKEQGKLVITIIHDMDFVAENFERTLVIQKGRVILDDHTREVFARKDILKSAHVDTPYITRLGEELGLPKTVLTIEEFAREFGKK